MSIVLDCSAVATWCFDDERSEGGDQVLADVAGSGAVVPAHWRLEVANMLWNGERRGRIAASVVSRKLKAFARLPIEMDDQTIERAWEQTRSLSRSTGLTIYDAAYLDLALRLNLPLATKDRELADAARDRRVGVLSV